jgi:Tfp pilus assembly protein PilF
MRRLEELGENPAPREAAGALESLGILRFIVSGETARAKQDFRRSVTLDPLRPQAWDGLLCLAVQEGDPAAMVAVCEERLKRNDTVWNRVAAAKTRLHAHQEAEALNHARVAAERDPNSVLARVCLAAVLLRRPFDDAGEQEVLQQFNQVLDLAKTKNDEEHQVLVIVAGVNWAIYCALDGNLEQARTMLASLERKAAATDDIKDRIKEIQTVLGN